MLSTGCSPPVVFLWEAGPRIVPRYAEDGEMDSGDFVMRAPKLSDIIMLLLFLLNPGELRAFGEGMKWP